MVQSSSMLDWRKSSYSGQQENCVEVACLPGGGRAVRDSKDPGGPTLDVSRDEWTSFVAEVRGEAFS